MIVMTAGKVRVVSTSTRHVWGGTGFRWADEGERAKDGQTVWTSCTPAQLIEQVDRELSDAIAYDPSNP